MKTKNKKQVKKQDGHAQLTADVTKASAQGSAYCTLRRDGRELLEEKFSIGCNSFGSFVGQNNVLISELNTLREEADFIKVALVNSPSETVFWYTKGNKGGLKGGKAELFDGLLGGEPTRFLRHSTSGCFVSEKLIRGLHIVTEAEIVSLAEKGDDIRKFVYHNLRETSFQVGEMKIPADSEKVLAGALIGSMSDMRQLLVVPTENGLQLVSLSTDARTNCNGLADNRSVEAGALNDADKATVRASIFGGIIATRRKDDKRNAERKVRKALQSAPIVVTAQAQAQA